MLNKEKFDKAKLRRGKGYSSENKGMNPQSYCHVEGMNESSFMKWVIQSEWVQARDD